MRTVENSLSPSKTQAPSLFLERMQFFYELFPYPNRPIFLKPNPKGSIDAHAGFAQILAGNSEIPAGSRIDDLQLRDVRHAFSINKRIALVGCGTDEPLLFRTLHPHNPMVAIDLSHRSLLRAERKIRWHQLKPVTLVHGDAQTVLKREGLFDHIQCFGVLHHQPHPKKLLKTMAESMNSGGTLRLMIYSSNGRRLERGLQKKFNALWRDILPHVSERQPSSKMIKLKITWASLKLLCWRLLLPVAASASKSGRFRYIGLSRARVADALLHPSDHALSLRDTLTWAGKYGLRLVSFRAKSYDLGWMEAHTHLQTPLQTLVAEEERGNISTNIVLVFQKVGSI